MGIMDCINTANALFTLGLFIMGLTWKKEQKRKTFVEFLEYFNRYLLELKYYEHNGTVFSKHSRVEGQEDCKNIELIEKQKNIIDTELAEYSSELLIKIENWKMQEPKQAEFLNNLSDSFNTYKNQILSFVQHKIEDKTNNHYDTSKCIEEQTELEKLRKEIESKIDELKKMNKILL